MIASMTETIRQFVALGGPVVFVLLCVSVAALAIAIAKIWQFVELGVGRHGSARAALKKWEKGDQGDAIEMAAAHRTLLSRIALMAMRGAYADGSETHVKVEERVTAEAETRLHKLESGFRALDAIAQLSPLMGLFGTVLGMIEAFRQLQAAGDAVEPSLLAGGIWVALLTTAVGLAVAMPTSLLLTWLESRVADERMAAQALIVSVFRPGLAEEPPIVVRRSSAGELASSANHSAANHAG